MQKILAQKRELAEKKQNKNKTTLELCFFYTNYKCGSLGNFKTAITLHDLCLEICVCTVYTFLLSFKLSTFLSLSFITQHHYRLTKNKILLYLVLNSISNYSYIEHRHTPKHAYPLTNNFNV